LNPPRDIDLHSKKTAAVIENELKRREEIENKKKMHEDL